jgi:excisionase family DNA binding protein
MSLQEVGNELGVSDQTVRRWVKAGELAAYKPGKEYRVKGSDLEEFLETREVGPKGPRPLSAEWALEVPREKMQREIKTADTARLHKLLAELTGDEYTHTREEVKAALKDEEKRAQAHRRVEALSRATDVWAELRARGEESPEKGLPALRKILELVGYV